MTFAQKEKAGLPEKLHIVLTAYGKMYLEMFKKFCIPNFMGLWSEIPDGLRKQTVFKIFTDKRNEAEIEGILKECGVFEMGIPCAIEMCINEDTPGLYSEMDRCQRLAMERAMDAGAALLFLFPDIVLSKGSFERIFKKVEEGYRCVLAHTLSAVKEDVEGLLKKHLMQGRLVISGREGARLGIHHLHPMVQDLFVDDWKKGKQKTYPYGFYKKVSENGVLVKFLLGYPIFLWPERKVLDYRGTFEMELLRKLFSDFKKIDVVKDSDELFGLELSRRDKVQYQKIIKNPFMRIMHAINNRSLHTDYHLKCALNTVIIHGEDLDERYEKTRKEFDRQINPALLLGLALRWWRAFLKGIMQLAEILLLYPLFFGVKILYYLVGQRIQSHLTGDEI